jgi:hypothetical protein
MPVDMKLSLLLVIVLLGSCESIGKSPAASSESQESDVPVRKDQSGHNVSQAAPDAKSVVWKKDTIDTTTDAGYLTHLRHFERLQQPVPLEFTGNLKLFSQPDRFL